MFKIGDTVSVIDDRISGLITEISKQLITIEDEDGFIRSYRPEQLAYIAPSTDYSIDHQNFDKEIQKKIQEDLVMPREVKISKKHIQKNNTQDQDFEIDLHIEVLTEDYRFMSNMEILQRQMMTCRAFIERIIQQKANRAILIHGKGEGVLKTEIQTYLNRIESLKHVQVNFHEADKNAYGGGATQVNITY